MSTDDVYVDLEPHDVEHAALVGVARYLVAREQRRDPTRGAGIGGIGGDVVGAIGELTVAHALGVVWRPNVGGCDGDVGDVEGYSVRATTLAAGKLIVRPQLHYDDDDAAVLVLVTLEALPRACIRGWIRAGEAKRVGEYHAPNGRPPAYFVPAYLLEPWAERPFLSRVTT